MFKKIPGSSPLEPLTPIGLIKKARLVKIVISAGFFKKPENKNRVSGRYIEYFRFALVMFASLVPP